MSSKPQSDLIKLEKELNHLWGELNTVNIPHQIRTELEDRLATIELDFKKMMDNGNIEAQFHDELASIDFTLAMAAIEQAKHEISKAEHTQSPYQALENVHKDLLAKTISPLQARHELKNIMRKRS